MGKKIRKPTSQAAAVSPTRLPIVCFSAMASGLQILADHANKKESDDIGEHDRDNAARRRAADVVGVCRKLENPEGDVGCGFAAVGRHADFRKYVEEEDRFDEHDDGDRPSDMREHDIEEVDR